MERERERERNIKIKTFLFLCLLLLVVLDHVVINGVQEVVHVHPQALVVQDTTVILSVVLRLQVHIVHVHQIAHFLGLLSLLAELNDALVDISGVAVLGPRHALHQV